MKPNARAKSFFTSAVLLLASYSQVQAFGILELAEEADIVVLGETLPMQSTQPGTVKLGIRVEMVLKGDVAPGSLVETVFLELNGGVFSGTPPSFPPKPNTYAFWFLKRLESGEYSGIPREGRDALTPYHKRSGSPVRRSWMPPTGVSTERVLLEATVEWYRSNADEPAFGGPDGPLGPYWLIQSLQYAHVHGARNEAQEIVDELLRSASAPERHTATIAGINMSYDPALAYLERNLESLRPNEKVIRDICYALEVFYRPSRPEGAMRIESLIRANQSARIPGLDTALSRAALRLPTPTR